MRSFINVNKEKDTIMSDSGIIFGAGVVVLVVAGGLLAGCPSYNVWQQSMAGKAELASADYTRQVAVVEAQAKLDAASKLAEAEVARAKGVAQANQIIGDSLKGNEAYLRYLWINNLDGKGDKQVIYVPTETGLPILEAGRLNKSPTNAQ